MNDIKYMLIITTVLLIMFLHGLITKRKRIQKLKGHRIKKIKHNKLNWLSKLIKDEDDDRIKLKLSQSGNPPFITAQNYYAIKLIGLLLLVFIFRKASIVMILMYAFVGYFGIDIYLNSRKRARHKEIRLIFDKFITTTTSGLKSGLTPYEVFLIAEDKFRDNPLAEELGKVRKEMSKGNLLTGLKKLRKSVDLDYMDNYCLSMMHYSYGGSVIKMLNAQQRSVRTNRNNEKIKETKVKGNLIALSYLAILLSGMLIVVIPMFLRVKDSWIF